MYLTIRSLPVRCGDCIFITYSNIHNLSETKILIDVGYSNTYHRTLKPIVEDLVKKGEKIDLFILTHTDGDHIGGAKPLLKDFGLNWFKKAWFNYSPNPYILNYDSNEVSIKQGIALRDILLNNKKVNKDPILSGIKYLIGNASLTILSPDISQFDKFVDEWKKEELLFPTDIPISINKNDYNESVDKLIHREFECDNSVSNRSSIAFLLDMNNNKFLFTSDAHTEVLEKSLRNMGYSPSNKIELKLMKVSHHGSRGNTSDKLMEYIKCNHYLISANAENKHLLPHKEALSRIIWSTHKQDPKRSIHLYFNYDNVILKSIFSNEEKQKFNLVEHYPDVEKEGIIIKYLIDE